MVWIKKMPRATCILEVTGQVARKSSCPRLFRLKPKLSRPKCSHVARILSGEVHRETKLIFVLKKGCAIYLDETNKHYKCVTLD